MSGLKVRALHADSFMDLCFLRGAVVCQESKKAACP